MRGVGRDLGIMARGLEPPVRQLRFVVTMDEIVNRTGVVGVAAGNVTRDRGGGGVAGNHVLVRPATAEQGKRMKCGRFKIVGIGALQLPHRHRIGLGARRRGSVAVAGA